MAEPSLPASVKTLPQFIRAAALSYGDDTAIVLKSENEPNVSITFRELDTRSAELARGLLARGMGKGSRVGFIHGNGPDFAVALAAIGRIGAIAIPISTLIKANELIRVLRQSDIGGLIVQRTMLGHDLVERLCDALPALRDQGPSLRLAEAPYLRWIVSNGPNLPSGIEDRAILISEAASVSENILLAVEAEVYPTDQLIEIYTSGSMALPKGVKHLHGPVMFRAEYLRAMLGIERSAEIAAFLPMFWVGGLMVSLMPNWMAGATTICGEATLVNSQMAMGSVLSDDDLAKMRQKKPYWGLGMTETLGPYSYGDELRVPGRPLCAPLDHFADRYEVRVVDAAGTPVGDGESGEIQVRGYALSPGLHKVERDPYYTADGFYRTGDMGLIDGKRVHFIGRDGDFIKTAGSNVSPAEVELEMQQLAGVHSAYVVGIPDAERGQLVVAAVVPRDGMELDFAAVQAELRKRLSGFKVPRAFVAITRDEVPMLPSNKVARRQIEVMMIERISRR
jgi:acyl-CoA synthetase (AMP-forming)/AMP-acid ligase II